jgi:Flp pilus assembly pilin Flp
MRHTLVRLIREETGQDLIEYAFLALFVALAVTVGLQAIATNMDSGYSNIGTQVGGS